LRQRSAHGHGKVLQLNRFGKEFPHAYGFGLIFGDSGRKPGTVDDRDVRAYLKQFLGQIISGAADTIRIEVIPKGT